MLNLKHLRYFREVARSGSITAAARQLNLTPQTISGQISELESRLGLELFLRRGRKLVLSEEGRLALDYAEEIFRLGGELESLLLQQRHGGRGWRLRVGMADVVPKSIATRLLAPALAAEDPIALQVREGSLEELLAQLALQRLDLVIADRALPDHLEISGHSRLLGQSAVALFAAAGLKGPWHRRFPEGLENAPLLLQTDRARIRRQLERWFSEQGIQPRIVGEFDDSAMAKTFGGSGAGLFAGPAVIRDDICRQYRVRHLGDLPLTERFYLITPKAELSHPAMAIILEAAETLFG